MIPISFQVKDKLEKANFFQKTFLLVVINMEVVLNMFFFTFSNTNIQFPNKELTQRSYITAEALSTIKRVELINKKKFAKAALDTELKTFVVYISVLEVL